MSVQGAGGTCSQVESFKNQVQSGVLHIALVKPNVCEKATSISSYAGRTIHDNQLEQWARAGYKIAVCVRRVDNKIENCSNPSDTFLKCIALGQNCGTTLNPGLTSYNLTVKANGRDRLEFDLSNAAGKYKIWFEIYNSNGNFVWQSPEFQFEVTYQQ